VEGIVIKAVASREACGEPAEVLYEAGVRLEDQGVERCIKQKSLVFDEAFLIKDRQRLTLPGIIPVPSALVGLTALFGMGRGDPHRYCHLKIFK
jgi:hypothetical protein